MQYNTSTLTAREIYAMVKLVGQREAVVCHDNRKPERRLVFGHSFLQNLFLRVVKEIAFPQLAQRKTERVFVDTQAQT